MFGALRNLLSPPHSIILVYDRVTDDLDAQITEVEKYYHFVRLSELVQALGKKKPKGIASLAFAHARQNLYRGTISSLVGREIPFTVFLRPDCIGLNRLPPDEEIALFAEKYPDKLPVDEAREWQEAAWKNPERAESFLSEARRKLGPLPVDKADPGMFMTTWGKIVEIPREIQDFGLHLPVHPSHTSIISDSLSFIRQQTGVQVNMALLSKETAPGDQSLRGLASQGVNAVVTNDEGIVEASTDPYRLPRWSLKDAKEKS